MAKRNFKVRMFFSYFGRNPNSLFSNDFLVQGDFPFRDVHFATLQNEIALALQPILHKECYIVRSTVAETRPAKFGPLPRGKNMDADHNLIGTRGPALPIKLGFENHVAYFKKSAGGGSKGSQKVRGCFIAGDVVPGPNGLAVLKDGFDKVPFNNFANNLPGIIKGAGFDLILNAAPGEDYIQNARKDIIVTFQGAGSHKITSRRDSIEKDRKELAQREINEAVETINKARDNGDGGLLDIAGDILVYITTLVGAIVQRYGKQVVLRLLLPPYLRPIINALPG